MKMHTLLVAAALMGVSAAFAAEPWEDPAVNAINRLPAREVAVPCENEQLAFDIKQMKKPKSASQWILPLAGEWDFKWKSATAVPDWEKTAKIQVPGCWQLQGDYDPPLYVNVRFPIEKDAPRVTKAPADPNWTATKYRNPVGLYTTSFKRPWKWYFRRTTLHFDGVSSAFKVRVNGKEVGYSEDSRLPAEFDITKYLKLWGENHLEVEVYKHSDGTYLEDQDFWRFSGIFRDVYLVSEHCKAPYDLIVETQLSDDMKSGKFIVRDEKGNVLKERDVPNVRLWSAEYPFVYMTPIEHKWGWWKFSGTDYRAVTFGFRKIEIRGSVIYLNGKRVLFKGANRHEMEPSTGYTVTLDGMRKDAKIMKEFNVNAVRTCHYPDVSEWYDICDKEGLMVICEANVESHGYGYGEETLAKRKDYEQAHVERGVRMVQTFRNHPSILFWSLGNEAGDGPNFTAERKAIEAIDKTRIIHYERSQDGENSQVKCPMYSPAVDAEQYVANNPKKPYVLCEYVHAMGNSSGSVQKYWDLVDKYPSFQGGFVWDFVDQAVWKTDARGKWLAYGGDFGDLPNDDNFNCNGFIDALRNPHPGAYAIKHAYQSIFCRGFDFDAGKVKVKNGFTFADLDFFYCRWQGLDANGEVVSHGTFELGELKPGETSEYQFKEFKGDIAVFRFMDDNNCIAWKWYAKPIPFAKAPVASPVQDGRFRMNFWRAPTDNDRGWKMPETCKVWKDATDSQQLPAGVKSELKTSKTADGSLFVDWTLVVPKGLPPIPRVGLTFTAPKTESVKWFGLGPWETYSDRESAAILGLHSASVGLVSGIADPVSGTVVYPEDRLNPDNYIEPGEQGYRSSCRKLTVGEVVIEAVEKPFGFNVWPYPQTMLEGKKHMWELKEADELTINVDAAQMGVGGDDSWSIRGAPHGEYMLRDGTYRLQFIVKGLK